MPQQHLRVDVSVFTHPAIARFLQHIDYFQIHACFELFEALSERNVLIVLASVKEDHGTVVLPHSHRLAHRVQWCNAPAPTDQYVTGSLFPIGREHSVRTVDPNARSAIEGGHKLAGPISEG